MGGDGDGGNVARGGQGMRFRGFPPKAADSWFSDGGCAGEMAGFAGVGSYGEDCSLLATAAGGVCN